jgi:cyclin H
MAAEIVSPSGSPAKKPLYEASTQYRNWRFSPEKLTQIRDSLNAAAVTVIRNTFEADEVCHA